MSAPVDLNGVGGQLCLADWLPITPPGRLAHRVGEGLEIVDAMQKVDTDHSDRPRTPVVINSVTITVAD